MKKQKKVKASKADMPDLVTAMMKLVERLEALEKKTEQLFSRVSNFPTEVRRAVQEIHPPRPYQPPQQAPRPEQSPQNQQNHAPRERILYQAVCADCLKRCEVPFKPSGDRPVYCPACFAIRKAGHVPKDITSQVVVPSHLKAPKPAPAGEAKPAAASHGKKPSKKTAAKTAKKKKK